MTRTSEQKKTLRGLYYAATLGSKAAAQKVKETINALRVGPRPKPAAKPTPRKAAPVIRKATATPKAAPLERDNGDRLMAARNFTREAHRIAEDAFNRYRNAPAPVARLVAAVAALPDIPTANHSLREWRVFTAKVEAARPTITKLMQAVR